MPTLLRGGSAVVLTVALSVAAAGCSTASDGSDTSSKNDSAASSSLAASGATNDSSAATLTVYSDQHANLIKALTGAYTKETGVKFKITEKANPGQIQAEGGNSPADVFLSEDPAPVAQLGKLSLLEKLDQKTLDQSRKGLNDPKGYWVAYAARTRALYYNPQKIKEDQLPKTLEGITDDKYKGKFAWAPSGAFVATTQYLLSAWGNDKTTIFLKKVKENGVNELKNGKIRDTVEAGKHEMGITNHYYWWVKAAEVGGPDKMTSKIYHFPSADPGNLILSSGAAVLKSSKNKEAANKFVEWLTAKDGGQKVIADSEVADSGAQYPAGKDSKSKVVGSLDDVKSPDYDMGIFADQSQAEKLLKSLGMSKK